jgi:hypothetical protein
VLIVEYSLKLKLGFIINQLTQNNNNIIPQKNSSNLKTIMYVLIAVGILYSIFKPRQQKKTILPSQTQEPIKDNKPEIRPESGEIKF